MNTGSENIPSRILDSLNQSIDAESDTHKKLLLVAKRASARARFSFIELARSDITSLRQLNENYDPRLSAWIMFAEGLISHFEGLDSHRAQERFKRSYAVAVATNDEELVCACLAWLATSSFVIGNISSALENLRRLLLRRKRPIESETLSRAYLLVADILSWSGDIEVARLWYKNARIEAVRVGDLATQSTILFNSAAFRISELTLRRCIGFSIQQSEIRLAALEVRSISSLEESIGQPYLNHLVKLLQAETLILEDRFQAASDAFDEPTLDRNNFQPKRLAPRVMAQRAWVYHNLSNTEKAKEVCTQLLGLVEECSDLDDLVVLYSRASSIFGGNGKNLMGIDFQLAFENCKLALHDMRSRMRNEIEEVLLEVNLQN